MKQVLQFTFLLVATFIFVKSNAKTAPPNIKKVSFYVRPVYSGGANMEEINIDGTTSGETKKLRSFQYFLYLETDCKNLKVSSVNIDQVKYQFQLKNVSSPIVLDGNEPRVLVKKSRYRVFEIADLRTGTEPNDDRVAAHKIVVKGSANGRAFTLTPIVKELDPLVAQ